MFGSPSRAALGLTTELVSGDNKPALSRQQARAIIESIRTKNGGITADDRANTRENVLEALESLQEKLGAAVNRCCRLP